MTPSTTQAPTPSPRCHFWARNNVVFPEPMMLCTMHRSWARDAVDPHRPQAHHVVVLPEPATPSSPWCPRAHDAIEPDHPLARNVIILTKPTRLHCIFCHFGPTNLDFDMLHCHIALICYIAFVLLHCFDVLHCHIALICDIATLLWYAILILICCIALIFYIAFILLYCFDMLHCHIAMICYKLLHCFCSATFWSIWMHTTLLNDKSGLSEMILATWTNIIVLLRFQLQTTWRR
jgi:hypothetical protein